MFGYDLFYLHITNSITLILSGNTIKLSLIFQRFLHANSYLFFRELFLLQFFSMTVFSFKNQLNVFYLFGVSYIFVH